MADHPLGPRADYPSDTEGPAEDDEQLLLEISIGYDDGGVSVLPKNSLEWQTHRANANITKWFDIVSDDLRGRSVIAKQNFARGVVVAEYFGYELLDPQALLDFERNSRENKIGPYDLEYMFVMSFETKRVAIQARREDGTIGRLINHAAKAEANCVARRLGSKGMPRIILVSKRPIMVGEELTYVYGDKMAQRLLNLRPIPR
jgi:hypothetical protein